MANKYSGEVRRKKDDSVQGMRGWKNEGIQRYNQLRRLVAADREERGDAFDHEMNDFIEELLTSKKKSKRVSLPPELNNDTSEEDDLEVLAV